VAGAPGGSADDGNAGDPGKEGRTDQGVVATEAIAGRVADAGHQAARCPVAARFTAPMEASALLALSALV
jgi:hypothetical protein